MFVIKTVYCRLELWSSRCAPFISDISWVKFGEVWWSVVGWSVVKCSGVLHCSDGLSNKMSNIIRRLMDNMKFLLICILRVLLSHSFIFFRFYLLSMYIWFYYCIFIVMTVYSHCMSTYDHPDCGFSVLFPQL